MCLGFSSVSLHSTPVEWVLVPPPRRGFTVICLVIGGVGGQDTGEVTSLGLQPQLNHRIVVVSSLQLAIVLLGKVVHRVCYKRYSI